MKFGFTLNKTGKWSKIKGEKGILEKGDYFSWSQSFEPKSPY